MARFNRKKPKKKSKKSKKYKKKAIPKALREQVWVHHFGEKFKHKCYVDWCTNDINVFDYHVGHNVPESKGGKLNIRNLKPICARCNLSMGDRYTITEWNSVNNLTDEIMRTPKFVEQRKKRWYLCC